MWLLLRSILWTILLPGFVAAYVPWRFFGFEPGTIDVSRPWSGLGVVCLAFGAALLAACIVEFARSGRGTLSPVDPPRLLVVHGLYRYVRNPMYLSVSLVVLGEALASGSAALGIYWAIWFAAVNLFVIAYEEPALRQKFGASYDDYAQRVNRWIPGRGR
jgi:protein-S-isoprenylcysteine O-methyltransferase Ste14